MYIAMNRFTLNPGQHEAFERRWRERNSHLKSVPGFIRFRLLKLDEEHYSSYAEWESEQAFVDWTRSEAFRKAHSGGMPSGVLAGHPRLEFWEVILEDA
ncbi:MAG: antibiotic biosynthesis monooxygenase [Candidatus Lambdaproteobacteria bacterium]|nr:antibiotic biosynthesis monooxygenase [Candidatus Lambdaproteobacteria bacterium]